MAAKETPVKKLYRHLRDKKCLCYVNEASGFERMSVFSYWIQELSDVSGKDNPSRCVYEQVQTIDKDALEDSGRKDEHGEYPSNEVKERDDAVHSTRELLGCPTNENTTDAPDRQISQDCDRHRCCSLEQIKDTLHSRRDGTGGDSLEQVENYHIDQRLQEEENRKHREDGAIKHEMPSETPEFIKQCPSQRIRCREEFVDASRDRMLLCLTVGKELFEATHCEQVHHLQLEMVGRGSLLEELSTLLTSEDRLVAFMTCKMARAVLLSAALDKDKVVSFLQHHLHGCVSTIKASMQNAGEQSVRQATRQPQKDDLKQDQVDMDQERSDEEVSQDQINPGQPNQGQVIQCETHHGQVNQGHTMQGQAGSGQTNQGQMNPHEVKQGLDTSSWVNQGQVNSVQDSFGQINVQQVNSISHVDPGQFHPSPVSQVLVNSGQEYLGRANTSELKPGDLYRSKVNPSQVNHAIFTFDLCHQLLKKVGDEAGQQLKEESGGMEGISQSCIRNPLLLAGKRCERLKDLQTELTHLLTRNLPDMLQAFTHPGSAKGPLRLTRVIVDSNDHTDTLLLASFLDLVHTLLNHGSADQHCQCFPAKITTPLMSLLREYYSDLIVLKKILDIFVVFTNQSAGTRLHSSTSLSSDHPHVVLDENVVTMATIFVDMVVKGNLFECIPFKSGPIGFGGGHFRSCGYDDREDNSESGGRPLLRKLCRATLSAVKILVCRGDSKSNINEAGVEECLKVLSQYISQKLNLDVTPHLSTWLFELFADQDDSLVWAMHCCLALYKTTESLQSPCRFIVIHLNPHRIFSRLLDAITHDPSVLLDLLISSETLFLEYLVQYLHAVIRDWDSFCHSHHEITTKDSQSYSKHFPIDVLDEESGDNEFIADDETVEDKPYLASNESKSYHERLEALGEKSLNSKRQQNELQGGINPERGSLQETSIYSTSRQVPSPTQGEEPVKDLFASTNIKSTLTNYSIPKVLKDLSSFSSDISSRFKKKKTETEGDIAPKNRHRQGPVPVTSREAPTLLTLPDKSECFSSSFTGADGSSDSADSYNFQNADVSSNQTIVPESLEDVMTTLIRLRFLIERISDSNLFPYSVKPLLRLLGRVEGMYEGKE